MASYSTTQHTLTFSANYNQLYVNHEDNGLVATYNLNASSQSVSVTITGSNFVIDYATTFTTPTHVWDVNGGDSFTFTSSTLDGIVIVDVRDINKQGGFPGSCEGDEGSKRERKRSYLLGTTTFFLRNVSEAHGFLIYFEGDSTCYTSQCP